MDKKTDLTKAQQAEILRRYLDKLLEEENINADLVTKCVDKLLELEGSELPSKRAMKKAQRELLKKMRQAEKEHSDKLNEK